MARDIWRMNFEPSGFFVCRTPLLPFDDFLAWGNGLQAANALDNSTELEQAFAADRLQLRQRLRDVYSRPDVREALFIASPHLDQSFELWLRDEQSERAEGIELALSRYFARMAGRATPFGLCAGCSIGTLGRDTRLELAARSSNRRHTRLDFDYLYELCQTLAREPMVRRALRYRPNSSLYRSAGRIRYVESRLDGDKRSNHLVAVEEIEALTRTLARACGGADFADLAAALVDDEVSQPDAEEFMDELIDSQILIADLAPGVTGAEPTQSVVEHLEKIAAAAEPATVLRQVHMQLTALDGAGLGNAPEEYRSIAHRLEALPARPELAHLFAVTMFKEARAATLGSAVLDEVVHGVKVLHRLTQPRHSGATDHLKSFREAFVARYEAREVPLVEALDAEAGIGFPVATHEATEGAPLLDGLDFPAATSEPANWGPREDFLLAKVSAALQSGAEEIDLRPDELDRISTADAAPLPDAFSVLAAVAAPSETAIASGDFRLYMHGATGPSGARFLGRFCHGDPVLHREVAKHLRAEEALQPDAIFAEVAYLPQPRVGNILARPLLRRYEIPYLAPSSVPVEQQIPVTDLLLSIAGERIVLRSKRLGREIIPRVTSAHNYQWRTLGLYHFLCLLQSQGVAENLGWTWGPLAAAPYLPRVTSGRLVLSRACWRLDVNEIKQLVAGRGAARFHAVNKWRQARHVPRIVAVAEGDNALPVDFENVLSVETFAQLISNRNEATLVEIFPTPDDLCVRGPEGRFVHELIIPFVRKIEPEPQERRAGEFVRAPSVDRAVRTFPPGSEWLYVKLYAGTEGVDRLLREVISPLVAKLLTSGAADQWFFIRYADPEWHVRLRFHGTAERLHDEALPALHEAVIPLLDARHIWQVQFDTYEREIERYGGIDGTLLAERIFHADSDAALQIVERLGSGVAGQDERWRLALRGIDLLLQEFGFAPSTKRELLRRARTSFAREFRADAALQKQIGERFRKEREELAALLDGKPDAEGPIALGLEVLQRRSVAMKRAIAELKANEAAGKLSIPLQELALSHVHMHVNRLLRSAHRAHELVLYEFLARLYDSQLARSNP